MPEINNMNRVIVFFLKEGGGALSSACYTVHVSGPEYGTMTFLKCS